MENLILHCIFWIFFLSKGQGYKDCTILIDLSKKKVPFFLDKTSIRKYEIYLKNPAYGAMRFKHNTTVVLHCHDKFILKNEKNFQNTSQIELLCNNSTLYYDMRQVSHEDYECSGFIMPTILKKTAHCNPVDINGDFLNPDNSSLVFLQFGFNLFKEFTHLYTICFDENEQIALWTYHVLKREKSEVTVKIKTSPFFVTNLPGQNLMFKGIEDKTLFTNYTFKNQVEQFLKILKIKTKKYLGKDVPIIDEKKHKFIKGHLTPRGDFCQLPLRFATFFYANAFPQSNILNDEGWQEMESDLRKYSKTNNLSLQIFSGLYKRLSYPDLKNISKDIHLLPDKRWIPFPKYVWKFVYDLESKAGIVFVGKNDYFSENFENEICISICQQTKFILMAKKPKSILCCKFQPLKKKIWSLPDFEVKLTLGFN